MGQQKYVDLIKSRTLSVRVPVISPPSVRFYREFELDQLRVFMKGKQFWTRRFIFIFLKRVKLFLESMLDNVLCTGDFDVLNSIGKLFEVIRAIAFQVLHLSLRGFFSNI